jgi:hypothetical protein
MTVARLLVHVEGQTEETFVKEILAPHLMSQGFESVGARIVGNARLRGRRGGIRAWPAVKKDILNHLREDPGCATTTMVDYYGLPQTGERGWPGRDAAQHLKTVDKAAQVQIALAAEVTAEMVTVSIRHVSCLSWLCTSLKGFCLVNARSSLMQ